MGYIFKGHSSAYDISSNIVVEKCDCCRKTALVQQLPAEHNAGELFYATLCAYCLEDLAKELRKHSKFKGKAKVESL